MFNKREKGHKPDSQANYHLVHFHAIVDWKMRHDTYKANSTPPSQVLTNNWIKDNLFGVCQTRRINIDTIKILGFKTW